ncbi:hypothetical protein [Nonomuraea bangladeshensis]|uniref:hypothetical protein n=1 Tax=Nonomuraea bangladeshensis TaxID=404385 RepID=UPI003C2B456D
MTALCPRRAALVGLFALLLISLVARSCFALWEPPFDGTVRYDGIRPLGGAYWPMNLYLGGPAYAVSWVATAIFLVLLARGRSGVLNLLGALLSASAGFSSRSRSPRRRCRSPTRPIPRCCPRPRDESSSTS